MAGLSIYMVKRGTFGMKDTINFKRIQNAFSAAEAGIEHGRKLLNDGANNTWDDELTAQAGADGITGTADDLDFISITSLNSDQSYTVRIADNIDLDTSALIDFDGQIWLISTGTSSTKTATIRVLVENDAQDTHISQEHYGEKNLGLAIEEDRAVSGQIRGEL